MLKLTDKTTKMFKPHRNIYREAKKSGDSEPWIIDDNDRVIYGMEQQLEEAVADIVGQQGVTSELVRGVMGSVAKVSEVVVSDTGSVVVDTVKEAKSGYQDVRYEALSAWEDDEKLKATGHTFKGLGKMLISPVTAIAKKTPQILYDTGRAVEDLIGLDFQVKDGFTIKLHDKGLARAVGSLGSAVWNTIKTPFAPFGRKAQKSIEAEKAAKKKAPKKDKPKKEKSHQEDDEDMKLAA